MRRYVMALAAVVGVGCAADSDGDGLSNAEEKEWGSDPEVTDSDGDGISDGEEVYSYGTHPAFEDSDADGFTDAEEIAAGVDPLDPDVRPYRGGWPILPADDKRAVADGPAAGGGEGDRFPRLRLKDQFKDVVDLYDFALEGKPILLDFAAEWCGPCNNVSAVIAGEDVPGYEYALAARELIDAGEIRWITVLGEDASGQYATWRTAKNWDRAYPNEHVPVLGDEQGEAVVSAGVPYWPYLIALDENFVITHTGDDAWDMLQGLAN